MCQAGAPCERGCSIGGARIGIASFFDKTGTLTRGAFPVVEEEWFGEGTASEGGGGGDAAPRLTHREVLQMVAAVESRSTHTHP